MEEDLPSPASAARTNQKGLTGMFRRPIKYRLLTPATIARRWHWTCSHCYWHIPFEVKAFTKDALPLSLFNEFFNHDCTEWKSLDSNDT